MDQTLLRDLILLLSGASLSAFGQWLLALREDRRRRQERLDIYRRDAAEAVVVASEAVSQLSLPVAALDYSSVECTSEDLASAQAAAQTARSHLLKLTINHPDPEVSRVSSEAADAIHVAVMDVSLWNAMNDRYGHERRPEVALTASKKQTAARAAVDALQQVVRATVS